MELEAYWKDGKMVIWGENNDGTWISKKKARTRKKARKSNMDMRLTAVL